MTPLTHYQQDLQRSDFVKDAAQQMAVEKLEALYQRLLLSAPEKKTRLLPRWFAKSGQQESIRGLYFWGGVGRGKTYLMDVFYESLPFEQKLRSHFHRFMQQIHQQLTALGGEKNPLDIIAKDIAQKYRVICFDEFFVTDITDAMILGGLFSQLFELGVVLVATSNIVPSQLYKNGLQRQRFLPAIAAIEKHCEVVNVDGGTDYRLRALEQANLYYTPLNAKAEEGMKQSFEKLAPAAIVEQAALEVNGRAFTARYESDDVVWFDFKELCDKPRSQNDYIELAKIYHAVLLSDVPVLGVENNDQARRFINLVDEFYDRHVKLIVSAEAPIDALYAGGGLAFEIERTQSRLLEMQSQEYLGLEHRP